MTPFGTNLPETNLPGTNLSWDEFAGTNLPGTNLPGTNLLATLQVHTYPPKQSKYVRKWLPCDSTGAPRQLVPLVPTKALWFLDVQVGLEDPVERSVSC